MNHTLPYDPASLLPEVKRAALLAGEKILAVYATNFEANTKADASPVTEADTAAEAIILPLLQRLTPGIPIVAEEAAAAGDIPDVGDGPFWLVDPLDGTKEFLKRNGEFTVNIALIANRQPILGVVLLPAKGRLYSGIIGCGAWRQDGDGPDIPISVRLAPQDGLTVIGSRSHGDAAEMARFLKGHQVAETISAGSSLKFCLVAEGAADVYPRLGRTMEWDTAAGHAVLAAAGGRVTLTDGEPFTYAKNAIFENPHFVAWGGVPV